MLKKFDDFKKQNEGMKKFSKIAKEKVNDSEELTENQKGKAPNPKYRNYEEEVNSEILANPTKPMKNTKAQGEFEDDNTNLKDSRVESTMDVSQIQAGDHSEESEDNNYGPVNLDDTEKTDEKVQMYGKVARFPKNTKASKAYNFLENVKISKNRIWYIMVEKQDNELQMVKYDMKKGVNLTNFLNDLKGYYINKYQDREDIKQQFEKIELAGDKDGNFSCIKNIPTLEVDGKKVITKITEDLIKILSMKAK